MTEKEKREDEALKNCIQEAYGLSDEQLLAELEEIEASLSDDEFVGAEERIYNRIKERENERTSVSSEIAASSETPTSEPTPIRKISKKKKWLIVGLAAALAVGAGVTTIGENNYFLKQFEEEKGVVLDSGKNIIRTGALEEAYDLIEEKLEISIIKMNYMPQGTKFEKVEIYNNRAVLTFKLEDEFFYIILVQKNTEGSMGVESDRKDKGISVYNKWLEEEIVVQENILAEGKTEYSALVNEENMMWRIVGKLDSDVLIKILEKLSY